MPSIKDVAKLAGVSVMTASRVLNNKGSVSQNARLKVQKAVKELDYIPNLTARSLRARRTHLLGLLVPDIENPIFASMVKYVEEAAQKRGYDVMLGSTWEDPKREASYYEIMLARQMEGIIVAPVANDNNRLFSNAASPVVVLDRSFSGDSAPASVTVDNREVGRLVAAHFLALGHRHFAAIMGPLHIDVFAERLEGFKSVLAEHGHDVDYIATVEVTGKMDYGAKAGEEVFAACRSRPLALFCANDMTALGAMKTALRLGLSIPADVSLAGVDGIPAGELGTPSLTTVRQPVRDMAARGVNALIDILEGKTSEAHPRRVLLKPELVVRESTGEYGKC